MTLATAESCTGGMVAAAITDDRRFLGRLPGRRGRVPQRGEERASRRRAGAARRSTGRSAKRSRGRWPRVRATRLGCGPRRLGHRHRGTGRRVAGEAGRARLVRGRDRRGTHRRAAALPADSREAVRLRATATALTCCGSRCEARAMSDACAASSASRSRMTCAHALLEAAEADSLGRSDVARREVGRRREPARHREVPR